MDKTEYKLEKINMTGRQMYGGKFKKYRIGDVHTCETEVEHAYLLSDFGHHWKDVTEYPKALPKPKKEVK